MYILSNALKNLGRNKGRNSLMGVILLVIIVATAVSIIINTTTDAIIKDYRERFGSEVFLNMDYEKAITEGKFTNDGESGNGVEEIPANKYFEFADSKYLKETQLTNSIMIDFPGLKALDESDEEGLFYRGLVVGTNLSTISKDFENGARKIIEGSVYKGKDECLISKQFAALNGLKVGDIVKIKANKDLYPLKICGIYEDNTMLGKSADLNPYMVKNPNNNRNNEFLVSTETASSLGVNGSVYATYFLKNPDMLGAFTKELFEKGLPSYYTVRTDEASYDAVVGPVVNMAEITTTFMIVVLVLGGIILLLISTLAIRERKYEIGVMRAMGMKKFKVAFGFILEMLTITAMCLVLGFGVATAVSQPITDSLLSSQIKIAQESKTNTTTSWSTDDNQPENLSPLSELNVSLSANSAMKITGIALLLAIVSSVIGVVYITRYEPMKILSERN